MRGVSAIGELEDFDWAAYPASERLYLRHRSIFVFQSLNGEDWTSDSRKIFFNVPAAEVGMEPDVIPSPEGARGVLMVAGEPGRKVGSFEFDFGRGDAGDGEIFDEDVRRHQYQTAHLVMNACMDEGNGGAVAVADEDGIFDGELPEEIGKRVPGFVMHECDLPSGGENIRIAGTVAGVDCDGAPGGGGDPRREILPERDCAQALVEKDEFRGMRMAGGQALYLQAMTGDEESL